jgi:hypothetical protein
VDIVEVHVIIMHLFAIITTLHVIIIIITIIIVGGVLRQRQSEQRQLCEISLIQLQL